MILVIGLQPGKFSSRDQYQYPVIDEYIVHNELILFSDFLSSQSLPSRDSSAETKNCVMIFMTKTFSDYPAKVGHGPGTEEFHITSGTFSLCKWRVKYL